jgi:hypothetical protein
MFSVIETGRVPLVEGSRDWRPTRFRSVAGAPVQHARRRNRSVLVLGWHWAREALHLVRASR